jgi:type IV pilus assembly protein PilY1
MRCKLCTLFCLIGVVCAAFALFQTRQSTAQTTHTITATAGTGGTITPSGAVTVAEGADQSFVITPDGTNSVAEVLVDGISQGPVSPYLFTNVTSDHYIEAIFNLSAECTDLSSVPLSAVKRAALPNIMFVLDDSGSMDWEFLTDEYSGKFQYHEYVFDNPGDNVFSGDILSGGDRKKWKSQWSGYNRLYYDPSVDYEPWPTLGNADLDTPRSHPVNSTPTFSLNYTYYLFEYDYDAIIVDNLDGAPWYVENPAWGGESLYDPEWDGSGRWTDTVGSTATFTPDLLVADTYKVYAWWNCWTQRDTNVKMNIVYDGGTDTIYRNQRSNDDNTPLCPDPSDPTSPCCGQWTPIGTYSFAAGTAGSVSIERHAGSTGSSTVADAVRFVPTLDIKNAHYYTFVDGNGNGEYDGGESVYLVVIEGTGGGYTIRYYEATVSGSGATEEVVDLVELAEGSVPESVISGRTAAEERQNFANWYSYYRRRELTATAAVANTIVNMEAVKIGFYSINQQLRQRVLPVKARGEDNTPDLLDSLYNLTLEPST